LPILYGNSRKYNATHCQEQRGVKRDQISAPSFSPDKRRRLETRAIEFIADLYAPPDISLIESTVDLCVILEAVFLRHTKIAKEDGSSEKEEREKK
jgi:hypothetical protein